MDFVVQWVWYLAAFAVGSLIAWLIVVSTTTVATEQEVHADSPAGDGPGTP
jgi:uncharacterized membrane protein ArfB